MSDILLDTQGAPTTPSANQVVTFATAQKLLSQKDDTGKVMALGGIRNQSTADQSIAAVDIYLTGSSLAVPAHLLQAGVYLRWRWVMTKTAAGVASPIIAVRVGTAGTTSDTARLTFTQVAAQTGVVDTAVYECWAVLRNIGASGVLAGALTMTHVLAITGFSTLGANVQQVTSAAFDTTVANLIVGLSGNWGASFSGTVQVMAAEMLNV